MKTHTHIPSRRDFIAKTGALSAGSFLLSGIAEALTIFNNPDEKMKIALVGTGVRGVSMFGKSVKEEYQDQVEFVGLSDINSGRLNYAKEYIGVDCPLFTDFDEMLKETKPDVVIVTTVDSTHHEFIIKGLEFGANVITEKPMTTDEDKCQAILDAERKSGKNVIVTFNYRYSPTDKKCMKC